MRDFLRRLSSEGGILEPSLVVGTVLALTSVAFFRSALLPEFGADLSMSPLQLGAVATVFGIGRLIADLPGGHLADRVPAIRILTYSALTVAAGSMLLGLAGSVMPVYLATFLMGLASSTTNATGMTYYSTVGGASYRGTAMAVYSASLLAGQAVGPALAGLVASQRDWRFAMYVASVIAVIVAIGLAVGSRSRGFTPKRREPEVTDGDNGDEEVSLWVRTVLHSVPFVVFLTLGSVPQTLVPIVGSDELGLSAAGIGLGLGAGGVARFVGTIIGGRLSDRLSRRIALVPGLIGQAIGVGIMAFPPTLVSWVVSILLMSVSSYAVAVSGTVVGDLADPARVGAHLGRFRFWGDIGLILGPISISAIYEGVGRTAAFLVVAGLLTAVGLACARFLPETRPSA